MSNPAELQKSIERYEQYVKVDPDNILLCMNLGDLYHQAGRLDDAIACYERCSSMQPEHPGVRSRIAAVMITQHRFADAEKVLRELLANGESDAALLHNLGLTLYYQKRWDEARSCFADASDNGLKAPMNYAYLARTLHQLGTMPEAIEAGRAWSESAQDIESKSYLALLYLDSGNTEGGRQLALDVLQTSPQDVDANVVAGVASAERQDNSDARAHFETALRHDSENGRAWLGLGLTHLYEQENEKAIDALENAVRIFPDNPGILVSLGWAKLIAKDPTGAERVFEHALQTDRNFGESHGGLAAALAFQQKLDRAQEEIKLARRLNPRGFGAEIAQTILLAVQGHEQAATEVFAKMLERSPQDGIAPLVEQLRIFSSKRRSN